MTASMPRQGDPPDAPADGAAASPTHQPTDDRAAVRARLSVLLAVAVGYVAIMVPLSPVSISLPTIAASLGVPIEDVSWISIAYLLILTALVLPAGRLGDLIGYKRVFVAGLGILLASSIAAGFVSDLVLIVFLRGAQGAGAAFVAGTALAILTAVFPASQRGRVVGVAAVAGAVGAGGGTLVTPIVLASVGWQAVFWLSVPVAILSLALLRRIPEPHRGTGRRSVDFLGAALLTGALLTLMISFHHLHDGERTYEAGSGFHVGALLLSVFLFAAFVGVERRVREPLIRLEYLRSTRFDSAVIANGIFHMTMMATFFLTPFLFERAWGLTPADSSLVMVVLQGLNIVAAFGAGWLVDRIRWQGLPALSLAGIALGMLLLGLLGPSLNYTTYMIVLILIGLSSGVFNTSNNTVIMSILPDEARGFSSGMLETTRQFGHTIAVSLGAVAIGLAGATLAGTTSPQVMLNGFQLAELIMGSIAGVGIVFALAGRVSRPARGVAAALRGSAVGAGPAVASAVEVACPEPSDGIPAALPQPAGLRPQP